ncbi:MAG: cyclic nucleotide-binding domain-containing protein [Actinomycetota bacterium]
MSSDPKAERLASLPIFAQCSESELSALATIADEIEVDAGREIVRQGSHHHHAYMVVSGGATASIDGAEVGTIDAGSIIGEVSMFDPGPASATVVSSQKSDLMVIEHGAFQDVLRQHPELSLTILRTLARRYHSVVDSH